MQQTTTPASGSTSFATKAVIVATSILMIVATPLALTQPTKADQFDDKINALQGQINQYNDQAGKLNKQANSLKQKLAIIGKEKAAIEAKIKLSQAKIDKLRRDIEASKKKIAQNRDAMGTIIADLYVDGDISPLEMLASSKNIGDFVDKQTYQTSARDTMNRTIKEVKALQKKLEADEKAVKKVLAEQQVQQKALAAKQAEQNRLLQQTKGKEAKYRQMVGSAQKQLEQVRSEQQAYFASLGGNTAGSVGAFQYRNFSGNMGCSGGYPYCGVMDSYADPWGLYNRECVSYSAWRATQMGKKVGNFAGQGNAGQWPTSASSWMGASVNNTPAVGAVAILPPTAGLAPIGHSMNVEAILGGGWIRISQYNFGGTGEFSTMDIQASGVVFVHFPSS